MKRSHPDRIRIGDLPVSGASPEVVLLLQRAAAPPHDEEHRDQTAAVAAFLAAGVTSTPAADPASPVPGPRRASTVRTVRVAAATLLTSVVFGGGLAAADVLPAPAQRFVASVLGTIGIPVPSPDGRSDGDRPDPSRSPVDLEYPVGPDQAPGAGSPSALPGVAGQMPSATPAPAPSDPAGSRPDGAPTGAPSGATDRPDSADGAEGTTRPTPSSNPSNPSKPDGTKSTGTSSGDGEQGTGGPQGQTGRSGSGQQSVAPSGQPSRSKPPTTKQAEKSPRS